MSGLSNPAGWLLEFIRGGNDKGSVPVNNNSMLSSSAIWYAITTIAGDVAKMPLEPRKELAGGKGSNVDKTHPAWRLLRDEPNRFQTADVFKEQIQGHALSWGNGRAAIIRNRSKVSELIPLMPDRTTTCMVMGEKYHVTCPLEDDPLRFAQLMEEIVEGHQIPKDCIVLSDAEVLHIMGFGHNGFVGLNIADVARDSFGTELGAQRYQKRGIDKGFAGRLMLEAPPGQLRDGDEAKKLLDAIRQKHENSKDGEAIGLLREGVTAKVLQMSNVDMQFIESRKFSRQDVMLWFGLQHIPGDDSSVSYNSLEQKLLAHRASALDKWLTRWEMQCDAKLRTRAEKAAGVVYFNFGNGHRDDCGSSQQTCPRQDTQPERGTRQVGPQPRGRWGRVREPGNISGQAGRGSTRTRGTNATGKQGGTIAYRSHGARGGKPGR